MAGAGEWKKADGDIFYGQDANESYYGKYGATLAYNAVSIATSATLIKAAGARAGLIILNNSTADIYLGASGVTTSTGYKLPAGKAYLFKDSEAIYGIVGSSTADVRYLEVTA